MVVSDLDEAPSPISSDSLVVSFEPMLTLPPPLFRYTKRAYAEDLLHRGKIRLGTLYEYKRIEDHAPMIGDEAEGVKSLYDNPAFASAGGLPRFARSVADRAIRNLPTDPSTRVLFNQCLFEEVHTSPDRWVYCMSKRLGARVMHSMDPAYDTCVRIDYVRAFFELICAELMRQRVITDGSRISECFYRDRVQHYLRDDGRDPAVLKAAKYAAQEEVRFVFVPVEPTTIAPRFLTLPKLRDLCELDPRVDSRRPDIARKGRAAF